MVDCPILACSSFAEKSSSTVETLVRTLRPEFPLHILQTETLTRQANRFLTLFRGTVMYAVKCNPSKEVIRALAKAGIKTFDAASIEEIRLIRKLVPKAKIHFMHTVKSREAIREAYFKHGVRIFVCDCGDELRKIVAETNLAPDLEIYVRLALPKNKQAAVDFSVKFGAPPDDAVLLLREARLIATRLGVMFHPGAQSRNPDVFRKGIQTAASVIKDSGVKVDALDVGGGFPVPYPGQDVPPLSDFIEVIHNTIDACGLSSLDLYCEPGRALVAEAGLLVARVELRKDKTLYLNDGIYGGLVEAAKFQGGFIYPLSLIRKEERAETGEDGQPLSLIPYRLCGPTCDSIDMAAGEFLLPEDVTEGDRIVFGNTGAYSVACRTNFNGFGTARSVVL